MYYPCILASVVPPLANWFVNWSMSIQNMIFVLKSSAWERPEASLVFQACHAVTEWLIKTLYWSKPIFEQSALIDTQQQAGYWFPPYPLILKNQSPQCHLQLHRRKSVVLSTMDPINLLLLTLPPQLWKCNGKGDGKF